MLSREHQQELDNLEARYLQTRKNRSAKPEPKPEPVKAPDPEIHVHVDMPEVKPTSPKKWVFKHKYDIHGKLTETTATCE